MNSQKFCYENEILGKIFIQGIGSFTAKSKKDENIIIPELHFITYFSEEEKTYISYCLELGIHFSDKKEKASILGLMQMNLEFLTTYIKTKEAVSIFIPQIKDEEFEKLYNEALVFIKIKQKESISKLIESIRNSNKEKTFDPYVIRFNEIKKCVA
ncbi:MAG: hypothetical protein ACRC4W_06025 [Treponemataceae bacterium]